MLLALTVLLLHPLAAPAAALTPLPINSGSLSSSSAIMLALTPAPVAANDDPKTSSSSDPAKPAAASPSPAPQPVFPTAVSYVPGQLMLIRADGTSPDADSESFSSSLSSSGRAPASMRLAPTPHASPLGEGRDMGTMRKWLILSAAEHGAATFDAWSTRRNLSEGIGYETNPLLRPFANSSALYAAVQVAPVLLDLLSRQMMRSSHPWERRIWWVPQSASTVASLAAGAHNMAIH